MGDEQDVQDNLLGSAVGPGPDQRMGSPAVPDRRLLKDWKSDLVAKQSVQLLGVSRRPQKGIRLQIGNEIER